MNWKSWIPLVMAVVLGLVAAKAARDAVARNRGTTTVPARMARVVVARGPVKPGHELTADMLTMGLIAAESAPGNAFTDPAAVVGRVTATPLFAGQPLIEELLAPRGAGMGIQALVPKGMRAITVEVNETSGLAGMLVPGCHVDVVSTLNGAGKDDTVACTIVQDVLVQAVGQRLTPGRYDEKEAQQPVRSVTLIASPRDAEAIELASSMGRTRLVLRGVEDRMLSDSDGVSFVELRREDVERVRTTVVAVSTPARQGDDGQTSATQPVESVRPAETLRPVETPFRPARHDPFADPHPGASARRTVTLIRGGARTEVVFDLPSDVAPKRAVTSGRE